MRRLLPAFAVVAVLALTLRATAQTYPSRPVTLIIPPAPGGSTDDDAVVKSLGEAVRKHPVDLSQDIVPHEQVSFEAFGTVPKAEIDKMAADRLGGGDQGGVRNHADL